MLSVLFGKMKFDFAIPCLKANDPLLTDISPWSIPVPIVRFDLTQLKKSETNPEQ